MDYRSCPVCEETIADAQRDIAKAKQQVAEAREHAARGCDAALDRERKRARKITRIEQGKVIVPVSLALASIVASIAWMVFMATPAEAPRLGRLPALVPQVSVCHASDDGAGIWICHPLPCMDAHEIRHLEIACDRRLP